MCGVGGGWGGFAKHKIQRTRTIYDFVGVPRTRVRRTEYRLRMVGIRRTRKGEVGGRGYRLILPNIHIHVGTIFSRSPRVLSVFLATGTT